jgi:hypothetical protein
MFGLGFFREEFRAEPPFESREEVVAEIRECNRFAAICQWACFLFAVLGVVGDGLNVSLGLEPSSWFLLAVVTGLNALIGHVHVVMGKHLLGCEGEG